MYCIIDVIYGVPVRRDALNEIESLGKDPEDVDVAELYSGGGNEIPAYCGVKLSDFDEATDMALDASKIRQKPTAAEVANAKAMIAALPPTVAAKIKDEIGVYFIFSTS